MTRRLRKDAVGRLFAFLLAAAFAVSSLPPAAAAAGAFEVRGVEVDASAENATAARDKALDEGDRRAFEALLDRLVEPGARARVPAVPIETIRDMVADFSIKDEKTSAVRYIATLDYRFNPDAVRQFLVEKGLPFVTASAAPVVIVPVFAGPGRDVLWDYPNPWRAAWDARGPADPLVPTIVPEGDLGDVSAISAEAAAAGDLERLRALAARYDAADALVSVARLITDSRSQTSLVTVRSSFYGADGPRWSTEDSLKSAAGESPEALLARAVAAVESELEARWRRTSTVDTASTSVVVVTVPISGIRDWVEVRRRLEDSVVVRKTEVLLLSRDRVRLELHYVGDLERLTDALGEADLTLARKQGEWILEPPARSGDGT